MTLFDRVLSHLVKMARHDGSKQYAWASAKEYESINPYELSGMQEQLRQQMIAEKGNNETGSHRSNLDH